MKAIAATDAAHAWIVGNALGAAGEPGASAVFRTADGGATWKRTGFGDGPARRRRLRRRAPRRAGRARQDLVHARRRPHVAAPPRASHDRADERGRRRPPARLGRRLGHAGRATRSSSPRATAARPGAGCASTCRRPSPAPCRPGRSPAPAGPASGSPATPACSPPPTAARRGSCSRSPPASRWPWPRPTRSTCWPRRRPSRSSPPPTAARRGWRAARTASSAQPLVAIAAVKAEPAQ